MKRLTRDKLSYVVLNFILFDLFYLCLSLFPLNVVSAIEKKTYYILIRLLMGNILNPVRYSIRHMREKTINR